MVKNSKSRFYVFSKCFLFIFLIYFFVGCSAATQAIKRGDELQKANNYYGSAQEYLTALRLDSANTDAKVKLCKVSGPAYQQKLAVANNFETSENYEVALANYRELNSFLSQVNSFNCLNFATINVEKKISEMSSSASEKHYKEAERYFSKADYELAIRKYEDALNISSPYKDSTGKIAESYYRIGDKQEKAGDFRLASRNYTKANETISGYKDCISRATDIHYAFGEYFLSKKHCRNAWEDFNKANTFTPNYKNVSENLKKADECSVIKVAFARFDNPTGRNIAGASVGDYISDEIKSNLQRDASRFIRFLDRDELQALFNEQGLGSKGISEDYTTFKKLKGVDYFIFGKLSQVNLISKPGNQETLVTNGKYYYDCTLTDKKGKQYQTTCEKDVPVQYTKHNKGIALSITGSIKMVSVSSGQQVVFRNISERREDSITYADQVVVPSGYYNRTIEYPDYIKNLYNQRKDLKDEDTLFKDIVNDVTGSMSQEVLAKIDRVSSVEDPKVLKMNR